MKRLATLILLPATLALATSVSAGPECASQFFAEGSASDLPASPQVAPLSTQSLEMLLATPLSLEQVPSASDPDLASTEHPMIPLPSPALAGLLMLGGVAFFVLRSQRPVRLR